MREMSRSGSSDGHKRRSKEPEPKSLGLDPKRENAGTGDGQAGQAESTANRRGKRHSEPSGSSNNGFAELAYGWPLRNFLVSCILLTLSIQRAHGYFIEQYLHNLGLLNVELSTLYRTLRELEKDGLVSSSWEPGPDGPARRVYSLTDAGRWWLDMGVATLRSYREIIDQFVNNYTGLGYGPKDEEE